MILLKTCFEACFLQASKSIRTLTKIGLTCCVLPCQPEVLHKDTSLEVAEKLYTNSDYVNSMTNDATRFGGGGLHIT